MLNTSDVACLLNRSVRTINRWAQSGNLPAFRVGRSYLFDQIEIDLWLEAQRIALCQHTPNSPNVVSTHGTNQNSFGSVTPTQKQEKLFDALQERRQKKTPGSSSRLSYDDIVRPSGKKPLSTSSNSEPTSHRRPVNSMHSQ